MNIKDLSLKKVLEDDWIYNPDFQYAGFDGTAELHKGDRIILFRRKNEKDIVVASFQAVGVCDKKLIQTANSMLAETGIDLRMGDSRSRIVKNFGLPDFTDCIEEGYCRYFRYGDYNDFYTKRFLLTRYHYLLAPDLLVCLGIPRKHYEKLTDVEIVTNLEMVSSIMNSRFACKDNGNESCPCKERLSLVRQTVENRSIEGIQAESVFFLESEINNCKIVRIQSKELHIVELKFKDCRIEGTQAENMQFAECVFENVEFRNDYKKGRIGIESCTFINCTFCDTFGASYVDIYDNQFQDCLFEGIKAGEGAKLLGNKFMDCIFQNIVWMGYGMCFNIVSRGKMAHILYKEHGGIEDNQFSDLRIEDVQVDINGVSFSQNMFNSVTFENATLKGQMEKNNKFLNCNKRSFVIYE